MLLANTVREAVAVSFDPLLVVGKFIAGAFARERDCRYDAHSGHGPGEHNEYVISDVAAFVHNAHDLRGPYESVDARHHQQRGKQYSEFVAKFRQT